MAHYWPLQVVCGGFFLFGSLCATESLRGPLERVADGTLVVLDIDDTLICYGDHLGSESWFVECFARTSGGAEFHRLAGLLAHHLPVQPVEEELPRWIAHLQERGVMVVGLTRREPTHPAVEDWMGKTGEQLLSAGFDLTLTAPDVDHSHYAHGVIFGGRDGKAQAFGDLLDQLCPERVMVIDDRYSDLAQLVEVAENCGIECEPIWYIARLIRPYDSEVAAQELEALLDFGGVLLEEADRECWALLERCE